jgi:hypothetical protein
MHSGSRSASCSSKATSEKTGAWSNNFECSSWKESRDRVNLLRAKAKPTAVWTKLTLRAENSEDGNSPFELRCINCDSKFQLRNPVKWNSEHKCKGAKTQLKMAFEKAGPGVQQFVVTAASNGQVPR